MRLAITVFLIQLSLFGHAQNIGIGITTPAAPLHIRNSGSELLRLQGNDPHITFYDNSGVAKGFMQTLGNNLNLGIFAGNPTGLVQFYTHNNLSMVLHPNTNVGIGTDTPSFKLTVQTSNSNYGVIHRSNDIIVGTWIGNTGGINGGWYGTYTNHPLMFFTNNAGPQITLLQNGNTGIGTINPIAKLHVVGDGEALRLSGSDTYFTLYNGAALKGYMWNKNGNDIELGTDDTNPNGNLMLSIKEIPQLVVQSDGRVRIGSTASIHPAGLSGLPKFTSFGPLCIKDSYFPAADEWSLDADSYNGRLYLSKNGSGRVYIEDDGSWINFSDMNFKEDSRLYKNVLNDILNLQISTYHYKWNTTNKLSFGLIAQNVVRYFPEIVSETQDKDGQKILGLNYAKTGVLAIKAIQEQQQIIETQEKKIETQQKKIDELEKRLLKLENKLK